MDNAERNYERLAEVFWNLPQKGEEEARREQAFMDDIIQKAHLDREIDGYLEGVETAFDGGAGVGRFSIPLAQRGIKVTHFDISQPMLTKAKELAREAGVEHRINFVQGALTDLGSYPAGSFDLVISFDAPISYTYPKHVQVLQELVRIARKSVVISVSSRLGSLPYLFNPIQKKQYIIDEDVNDPLVQWYIINEARQLKTWQPDFHLAAEFLRTGLADDPDELYERMEQGETPWPINYCFLPEELKSILESAGLRKLRLSGPGALARTVPREILRRMLCTAEYRQQFLDQCFTFDSQPSVCGFGKDNLVASGIKA